MRIAIVTHSKSVIGGVETYLEEVIPKFLRRGHVLGFWAETASLGGEYEIRMPPSIKIWSAAADPEQALADLRAWQPDVLYTHGLANPSVEEDVFAIAPTVFFIHAYHGACISGHKAFAFPRRRPCTRPFDAGCLLHYFPRRCGGLNPWSMWDHYQRNARRLRLLRSCAAIIVASEHMVWEYRRYGLRPAVVGYGVFSESAPAEGLAPCDKELHLLFLGRMEKLKGGDLLLDALPSVARKLGRTIVCRFAGQGRLKAAWMQQAAGITASDARVEIEFLGWVNTAQRRELFQRSHLLIVPSVWPEPFGRIGYEAGLHSVPAVAFDVGGISQWLREGVNGVLAASDPPSAAALGEGICKAAAPSLYGTLRRGAYGCAVDAAAANHVERLEEIFRAAMSASSSSPTITTPRAVSAAPER